MHKIAISGLLCFLVLGACATMTPQTPEQLYLRHRTILKLAVQLSVVETLHRHKALAQPIAAIAEALQKELVGQERDIDFLRAVVQKKMATMLLSPTEQLLLLSLMETIVETMRSHFVDQGVIPTQVLLRISEVLGWIGEAAQMQSALPPPGL